MLSKEDKNALQAKGIKVLRHQYFDKKRCYCIMYYTASGGWKKLEEENNEYASVDLVTEHMNFLAYWYPSKYKIDR